MNNDEYYMALALEQAHIAYKLGEVPVGAVIVKDGQVIASAHNTRESKQDPLGHAEINSIVQASKALDSWRLSGCTLYVTLEPCPMCAGAILNARMDKVVYGAFDEDGGCLGSKIHLFELGFIHRPNVKCGVLEKECAQLMRDFFIDVRKSENLK